jgi:uncharacterized membrane protein
MELLVVLLAAALLGLFVAYSDVKARLRRVEARLDALDGPLTVIREPVPVPVAAPPPTAPPLAAQPEPDGILEEEAARSESLGGLFERLVAGKLLIWLGGIALFLAAVFLIRYSIEMGLTTPRQRMTAAAIFGLALIGLGEYARRGRPFAGDVRFAQTFVGAGVAILYATAYGSYSFYHLIDSPTASGVMLAITAAALILSLRHGAPAAVMALIGGFLTPLLVGNPDAGAVPLLAYLALLDLAVFVIAWRRGWTWLAAAATVLSFVWSGWLLSRPPDDALASGVFIALLAFAAAVVRPGAGRQLSLIQPLAIGIVQLAVLVARTDLGVEAWLLFGALAAAAMALAALRDGHRPAPPIALGLALVLLAIKAGLTDDALVPQAAQGATLLFGGGGLALALWRPRLDWTAIAATGFTAPFLILRIGRPELLTPAGWGGLALLLAAGPAALVWLARRAARPDSLAPGLAAAAVAAALLLGAAVFDLLPFAWIAAGWLGVALAFAWAARRLEDRAMLLVTSTIAGVAAVRCMWGVEALLDATIPATFGQPVLAAALPGAALALKALAVPAVLLVAIALAVAPLSQARPRAIYWLAGLFAFSALYIWFKQAFGLASPEDFVARGLLERTILTQALFVLGFLFAAGIARVPRFDVRAAGTMLTALAAARFAGFDLILFNPAWVEQQVGALPLLNLILPAYLFSAAWLYLARRRATAAASGMWLILFLAALVAGVALLVRQGFHGTILVASETPRLEFYGYSLAGILVAIALIVAGMRLKDKALRIAGLLLLTATVLKVFLIDASELKGLLRILSFLGLGIALIGIGRLYGPVLRAEGGGATGEE